MSVCSLPFGRLLRLCGNNWRFIRRSRLCLAYFNTYERRRKKREKRRIHLMEMDGKWGAQQHNVNSRSRRRRRGEKIRRKVHGRRRSSFFKKRRVRERDLHFLRHSTLFLFYFHPLLSFVVVSPAPNGAWL